MHETPRFSLAGLSAPLPSTRGGARLGCLIAASLAALLLSGCDEGQSFDPRRCDPITAQGCPEGLRCRLVEGGLTDCVAPSSPPDGATCRLGSCAIGETCATIEGALNCHQVCDPEDDQCPGAGRCSYRLGPTQWGICAPHCTLDTPCPPGLNCVPTAGLRHLICAAEGPRAEGERCTDTQRCQVGLACLISEGAGACHRLCDPDAPSPCPTGACLGQIMQVDDVGYCAGG